MAQYLMYYSIMTQLYRRVYPRIRIDYFHLIRNNTVSLRFHARTRPHRSPQYVLQAQTAVTP